MKTRLVLELLLSVLPVKKWKLSVDVNLLREDELAWTVFN